MSLIQRVALGVYRQPLFGRVLRTRLGSAAFVAAYDLYKDLHETPGNRALAGWVKPGTWVIDVGANIGFFTRRFSRWVSAGGRVIAIEPDSENLALLNGRLASDGVTNVDVHQAVAIEQSGTAHLQRNPEHPGDHRIGTVGDAVAAVTIDDLVERAGLPPVSLIKIDTQGSEARVLAGATRTLDRCKPTLYVEVDDAALRENGASAAVLVGSLVSRGYRLFKVSRARGDAAVDPTAVEDVIAASKDGYLDLLCVHGA